MTEVTVYNPYILGLLGNWRKKKEYLFLTDRLHSKTNNNTNIREDGIYKKFSCFWKPQTIGWTTPTDLNTYIPSWRWTSEVTHCSPYGFEIETKDPLNRYSAADYGYNNTLPKAVVANSKYREMGFDGFEDYDTYICKSDHFSFRKDFLNSATMNESHTGRKSIHVPAGGSVHVIKRIVANDCNEPNPLPLTESSTSGGGN
jgi:hypothetical protein